jgi:hypothetical protein
VLHPPLAVDLVDRPVRVLADRARALVRAEPRVVVNGVVGEVLGDAIRVTGVERLVVAANVAELVDVRILSGACRSGRRPFVVRVKRGQSRRCNEPRRHE